MQIYFKLAGLEYRGKGFWTDDEGFTAELVSLTTPNLARTIPDLPRLLLVRVDEARTAILVEPRLAEKWLVRRLSNFVFNHH